MVLAEFDYTKANNKTSHRDVMVLEATEKYILGYDLQELDPISWGDFADALDALDKQDPEYNALVSRVAEEFDLKHSLRNFLVSRMTKLSLEEF